MALCGAANRFASGLVLNSVSMQMASDDTAPPEESTSQPQAGPNRRPVTYRNLPALLEDAEQLASGPHKTVGELSFGQILQHLGRTMQACFDGYGDFRPNFFLKLMAKWFFRRKFIHREIPPGYKMPKKIPTIHPDEDAGVEEGLAEIRAAIKRFEKESPLPVHPMFGKMTTDEWIQMQLRHAELHMSFVWPA